MTVEAMEANRHFHMTYFATFSGAIALVPAPDVTIVQTQIPDDTFNYALGAKFSRANAELRIDEVAALYRQHNLPMSWWVGPLDTPEDLCDTLAARGFAFKEENVGMYLPLEQFTLSQRSHPLRFAQVSTKRDLKAFCDVLSCIGIHPSTYEKIYAQLPAQAYREGAPLEMHLGFFEGSAVVTGILVLHADVAGIYFIVTLPSHRRRGYATALMEYLLLRAQRKGYTTATLQASQEGKPVYERMGFRACGSVHEFSMQKTAL